MIQEKLIIGDNMKRYTYFLWYDKDRKYRLTQCVAKTIEDAEHQFADVIDLPYIKAAGKKEWHFAIDQKWWPPLKMYRYRDVWASDHLIRNNFITGYIKVSEDIDVPCKESLFFTFALGCKEGGPFIFQFEAPSLDEAMPIWIKRIPYQRYLSKEYRIKLKTILLNNYTIEEISGMKNAYRIDWEGRESSLFVVKDYLRESKD